MFVATMEEESLPKNPDLELAQWKFLLSTSDEVYKEKAPVKAKLLNAVVENGTLHHVLHLRVRKLIAAQR